MTKSMMLLLLALGLVACKPGPTVPSGPAAPPTPRVDAGRPDLTRPMSPSTDSSVPSAGAVLAAPSPAAPAAPAQARSNSALSRADESRAMPMPGQANDHSVPQVPQVPARPGAKP